LGPFVSYFVDFYPRLYAFSRSGNVLERSLEVARSFFAPKKCVQNSQYGVTGADALIVG